MAVPGLRQAIHALIEASAPASRSQMNIFVPQRDPLVGARIRELAQSGARADDIWRETMSYRVPGTKRWATEIDDSGASISLDDIGDSEYGAVELGHVLRHPRLYRETPGMDEVELKYFPGQYAGHGVTTYSDGREKDMFMFGLDTLRGKGLHDPREAVVHEAQHGGQFRFGWPHGASVDSIDVPDLGAFDTGLERHFRDTASAAAARAEATLNGDDRAVADAADFVLRAYLRAPRDDSFKRFAQTVGYLNTPGERQARQAQYSVDWGMDQRRAIPPWRRPDPAPRMILENFLRGGAGVGAMGLAYGGVRAALNDELERV